MKPKKIVGLIVLVLGMLLIVILLWWYKTTEPLEESGTQTYQMPSESGIVVGIANKSYFKVKLLDVTVNGESTTEPIYLGVSFDTSTYVTMSSDQDPNIEFMNIRDYPIYTRLMGKEAQEAIKRKKHTPIHYGIRIVNNSKEPIKYVTIRYKYLGFTKSQTITWSFDTF